MSETNIPCPARSKRPSHTPRASRSVCSPGRSNASGRLTAVISQFKENDMTSFVLSPLKRRSVLSDNTHIEHPGRQSWWTKIDESSRSVMKLLDNNKIDEDIDNVTKDEYIDVEILSKEKKFEILDLPELSDNESINSINLQQKKLFSNKDTRVKNKFDQLSIQRESLGLNKTNLDILEVNTAPKKLLNKGPKTSKPAFPAALLNLSPNKTITNKTKELLLTQPEFQVRTLFGNRAGPKRKKTFADFIVSESEDDNHSSITSRIAREYSPSSSIATDIEPDDWILLPSSTMVGKQLEHIVENTPAKKLKQRKLSEDKEFEDGSKADSTLNKSNQPPNRSKRSNNKNTSQQDVISENRNVSTKQINSSKVQNNSKTVIITQQNSDNDEKFVLEYVHDKILEPEEMNKENDILTSNNKEISLKDKHVIRNSSNTFEKTNSNMRKNVDEEMQRVGQEVDNDSNEEHEQDLNQEIDDIEEQVISIEEMENNEKGNNGNQYEQDVYNEQNQDIRNVDQKIVDNELEINDEEQVIVNEEMVYDEELSDHNQNEEDEQDLEQQNNNEKLDIVNVDQEMHDNESDNDQNVVAQDMEQEIEDDVEPDIENERNVNEEIKNDGQKVDNDENNKNEHDLVEKTNDDDNQEIEGDEPKIEKKTEDGEENIDHHIESYEPEIEDDEQEVENETEDDENLEDEVESDNEVVTEEQDSEEIDQDENQDIEQNESDEQNDGDEMSQLETDDDDDIHDATNESQEEIELSAQELQANARNDNIERNRKDVSPEAVLQNHKCNVDSFTARAHTTNVRKTKSINKGLSIMMQGLISERDNTGYSDGTTYSSVERSGWDSHGTTRKTLRQTFGKDFTPRKSLRTLVMEKSAKRQTALLEANLKSNLRKTTLNEVNREIPQANSTELPEISHNVEEDEVFEESNHEASKIRRRAAFEEMIQKVRSHNMNVRIKVEEEVKKFLETKTRVTRDNRIFEVPLKPAPRKVTTKINPQKKSSKSKTKELPNGLPKEFYDDMKYKPPKRFQPRSAPWITNRLYKFLESKLEPRYSYRARVRSEQLVKTLYEFTSVVRRHSYKARQAPPDTIDALKYEMARLNIVTTHFEFYNFFHEFMPREIRIMVNPDIVNDIPLPREGVFSNILQRDV